MSNKMKERIISAFVAAIVFAVAFFVVQGCSDKQSKKRDETYTKLTSISEDIRKVYNDLYYAMNDDDLDLDSAVEFIGCAYYDLEDIQEAVDALADQYADRD